MTQSNPNLSLNQQGTGIVLLQNRLHKMAYTVSGGSQGYSEVPISLGISADLGIQKQVGEELYRRLRGIGERRAKGKHRGSSRPRMVPSSFGDVLAVSAF